MRKLAFALLGFLILPGCAAAPHMAAHAKAPAPAADASLAPMAQSELYLGVVDGLIRQQRFEAAIAFLAKYQKSEPLTPRYQKLAGDALTGAGRTGEAVMAYRQALKSELAAEAYNGIGRALAANGNWAEAAENFRQAATLDPANAGYLNNFGYAQLKQNFRGADLAPAVSEFRRAHELDPGSSLIRDNLALALSRSGADGQLREFLGTISDPVRRQQVADFSAGWTPAWNGDTGLKAGAP